MLTLAQIVLGGLLLIAGRRLYWLLAAGAGFVLGLILVQSLFRDQSDTATLIVALIVAVVFAVLAVVGQKFIIGLVGFVAGGIGLVRILQALNLAPAESMTLLSIAIFLVGGIAGAFLMSKLFTLGLIVLSSVIGAEMLLTGLRQVVAVPDGFGTLALVALIALGIVVQTNFLRRS